MPVAPTPPTKPTPPVAPAHATSTDSSPTATSAGTTSTAKQANPDVSGVANKIEGLGKAFQGNTMQSNPAQTKDTKKSEPAAATTQTNAGAAASMNSFDTQKNAPAQTAAPAKMPALDNQTSSFSYLPFLGIVVITAVILVGMRLFKNRTTKLQTSTDFHKKTDTITPKAGINIVASPNAKASKTKSSFEVRV